MLQAELHGKLGDGAHARDRMEDVLTSDVFGVLSYLSPEVALLPWLRRARAVSDVERPLVEGKVEQVELVFWPRTGRKEMDLLAVLRSVHGTHLVGIECKYESGKSSFAGDGKNGPTAEGPSSGDQLGDYMGSLCRDEIKPLTYQPAEVRRRSLVYVTAHAAPPHEDLKESARQMGEALAKELFWLPWRDLARFLPMKEGDPGLQRLSRDLLQVLRRRGLSIFTGWTAPKLDVALPTDVNFFRTTVGRRFFTGLMPVDPPAERTFWRARTRRKGRGE